MVIRINNNGELVNSRPCNHCIQNLKMFGVKVVYYSNSQGEIVKESVSDIESEHVTGGQRRYYKYLGGPI